MQALGTARLACGAAALPLRSRRRAAPAAARAPGCCAAPPPPPASAAPRGSAAQHARGAAPAACSSSSSSSSSRREALAALLGALALGPAVSAARADDAFGSASALDLPPPAALGDALGSASDAVPAAAGDAAAPLAADASAAASAPPLPPATPAPAAAASSGTVRTLTDEERLLLEQNQRIKSLNRAPDDFPAFIRKGTRPATNQPSSAISLRHRLFRYLTLFPHTPVRAGYEVTVLADGYVYQDNGLIYKDFELGTGDAPVDGQQIVFNYAAYNESGGLIDSSYRQARRVRPVWLACMHACAHARTAAGGRLSLFVLHLRDRTARLRRGWASTA
jgi:hypothetical protein